MLYIWSTNVRHPDPGLILYHKGQTSRYTVSECPSTAFSQYLLDGATTCHRNQVNTSVQQSCRRGQRFLSACLAYSGGGVRPNHATFDDREWPWKPAPEGSNFSGRSPSVCLYRLTNSDHRRPLWQAVSDTLTETATSCSNRAYKWGALVSYVFFTRATLCPGVFCLYVRLCPSHRRYCA